MTRSAGCATALMLCLALPTWVSAQSLRDVFRRVSPSVVVVHTEHPAAVAPGSRASVGAAPTATQNLGTGVLVSPDGKVLTAHHVVQSAARVEIEFATGQRVDARVVTAVPFADLALLQVPAVPEGIQWAELGDSDAVEVGDVVFAVGGPYGLKHSLAAGWVGARRGPEKTAERLTPLELIQIDAALYEGNSGGPVFDVDGRVVGIVSHALVSAGTTGGPGFAVASNLARLLLESEGRWLGVDTHLIEGPLAEVFNLPQPAGLLVQSVATNSLAWHLGLRGGSVPVVLAGQTVLAGGDIILRMFGLEVHASTESLRAIAGALDELQPGAHVQVRVLRAGHVIDLTTRVPAAP